MSEPATLPTSFFQGKPLEEGTRCEVEIISVNGDQVNVRYVPHGTEDTSDHPSTDAMVDGAVAAQGESGAY